ncbi:MAG: FAD-dependent oxidoreductase [Lachnospiraceae bacterium]|nr:FAD-dependent oxidoreductase [Lachnospiraceae bacterium]
MSRYVIVGGVAGGASAAARLRRLDEEAEIILIERGPDISYANCGLPYYIGGVIESDEDLLLQTPESFYARFRVTVCTRSEVRAIDRAAKQVSGCHLDTGETFSLKYDKLILSTGAAPVVPKLPGISLPGVYTLRNVQDSQAILQAAQQTEGGRVVVVGGGFIGLEVAENLRHRGLNVTIVEAAPQIMAPFDEEMAAILTRTLEKAGIEVLLGAPITGIQEDKNEYRVFVGMNKTVTCDFVVLAIGVRPETTLAEQAGLKLDERKFIVTDNALRTSDPDIYAVGDAIEVENQITRRRGSLALAGPANRQGRLAAGNVCGARQGFRGVVGASVLKLFDRTAACTGVNERTLRELGMSYEKIYISPLNHAGYYPGGSPIYLKLLFDLDGRILGAQAVGGEGTDKRMDVIGTAMQMGGRVSDLENLELGYAPAYSSAKDPVNMAGMVSGNVLAGLAPVFHWHDLAERDPENSCLVDVRTEEEYQNGHLEGAVNLPVDELRERLGELPQEKELWIYCQAGLRGYIAQRILMQKDFKKVRNLSGGYGLLQAMGKV